MAALIIGTYFKRPKAPVEFTNDDGKSKTTYFFKPVDPKNPDSEHVCVIENPKHQAKLLAIEEGYYVSEAQLTVEAAAAAASSIKKPEATAEAATVAAAPAQAQAAQVSPQSEPAPPEASSDPTTAAHALLALKLNQFKAELANAPQDVVKAALEIENGKLEDDIRSTYVKALTSALKG